MASPVEEIKDRLNIVDVVGEYVQLKKTGANHKGLCPFHNETTPSFSVSESKQFYYCFGCGKGGDVFSFVQEMEGMEFAEALRSLAIKANVELKEFNPKDQNEKTRLMDCNTLAAQFFYAALKQSDEAQKAREYIEGRKLTEETVEQFHLGYAPDSWDTLLKLLKSKQFSEKEIEQAGLAVRSEKNNSLYDRFRGRLMFPIHNVHGNVIGFTARALNSEEKGAKYINTPQTKVYNKSAVLYGLHLAKKHIQEMDAVVLVEGNMDVVSAHQAKFRNVVAASGTALTTDQVQLLKRYTQNIILAFDGDAAGMRASWRGMEIAIRAGMNIKVLELPQDQDPDDVIKRDPEEFRRLALEAQPFMDFAFAHILSPLDMTKVEDKKKAAAELLPMIALFPDAIEQTHYVQRLADIVQVEAHMLQEKLQPFSNQASSRPVPQSQKPVQQVHTETLRQQLAHRLLALFLVAPDFLEEEDVSEWFEEPYKGLYKKITSQYNQNESFTNDDLLSLGENPQEQSLIQQVSLIAEEMYSGLTEDALEKEYRTIFNRLERDTINERLQAVRTQLSLAEQQKDSDAIERLSNEFHHLTQALKNLG